MNEPMTFLDFFSGVGGFRKGFELCGMVCIITLLMRILRRISTPISPSARSLLSMIRA